EPRPERPESTMVEPAHADGADAMLHHHGVHAHALGHGGNPGRPRVPQLPAEPR
ncbi:hypothetical protein HPB47_004334, partial [Ixodes persulcatus]